MKPCTRCADSNCFNVLLLLPSLLAEDQLVGATRDSKWQHLKDVPLSPCLVPVCVGFLQLLSCSFAVAFGRRSSAWRRDGYNRLQTHVQQIVNEGCATLEHSKDLGAVRGLRLVANATHAIFYAWQSLCLEDHQVPSIGVMRRSADAHGDRGDLKAALLDMTADVRAYARWIYGSQRSEAHAPVVAFWDSWSHSAQRCINEILDMPASPTDANLALVLLLLSYDMHRAVLLGGSDAPLTMAAGVLTNMESLRGKVSAGGTAPPQSLDWKCRVIEPHDIDGVANSIYTAVRNLAVKTVHGDKPSASGGGGEIVGGIQPVRLLLPHTSPVLEL